MAGMASMAEGAQARIEGFFDVATSTVSYLVLDPATRACAIVDSVLDYDARSGRTSTRSAELLMARVHALGAQVEWILETHVHADHLSAAPFLKQQLGGRIAIGSHITAVQATFGSLFNAGADFARDGSQFDHLFADDEAFFIGTLAARAMHTPGHTPACMTYVVGRAEADGGAGHADSAGGAGDGGAAFVGDTLFMPDYGSARCDFPGGDAALLYRSIRRVLALPAATRLYLCHDYQPGGRALQFVSTVAEQRAHNVHVHDGIAEAAFVAMRQARDLTLDMPALMLPSVQVNMRAGHLPAAEDNGTRYIKIPLDTL